MLVFISVKYSSLTNDFSHKRHNMRRGPILVLRGGGDRIKRVKIVWFTESEEVYRLVSVLHVALPFRHLSFCHRRLKRRSHLVGFLIWFDFRQSFVSHVVIYLYISYLCGFFGVFLFLWGNDEDDILCVQSVLLTLTPVDWKYAM